MNRVSISESTKIYSSGELWEASDSRREIACVTGCGVLKIILVPLPGESGSSTLEGSGEKGPTGICSGTVFKVGTKGIVLISRECFFLVLCLDEDNFLLLIFLLVLSTCADLICLGGVLEMSTASTGRGVVSAKSSSISTSEIPVMKSSGSLIRCSRQFFRSSSSLLDSEGGGGGEKEDEGEGEDMRGVEVG